MVPDFCPVKANIPLSPSRFHLNALRIVEGFYVGDRGGLGDGGATWATVSKWTKQSKCTY